MLHLARLSFRKNRSTVTSISISHVCQTQIKLLQKAGTLLWFRQPVRQTIPKLRFCQDFNCLDQSLTSKLSLQLFAFIFDFRFVSVSDVYEPVDQGLESQIFISRSYDPTTHFMTTCQDVLNIFERGTKEAFDFNKITHLSLEDAE